MSICSLRCALTTVHQLFLCSLDSITGPREEFLKQNYSSLSLFAYKVHGYLLWENPATTIASIWCTLGTQVADARALQAHYTVLVMIQLASTTLMLFIGNCWLGTLSTGTSFWRCGGKFMTYHKHVPVTLRQCREAARQPGQNIWGVQGGASKNFWHSKSLPGGAEMAVTLIVILQLYTTIYTAVNIAIGQVTVWPWHFAEKLTGIHALCLFSNSTWLHLETLMLHLNAS